MLVDMFILLIKRKLSATMRDRTFLAFSYAILIKQIFRMLTDSAIQLL